MSRLIDADDMIDKYIEQGSIYDTSDLKEMLHYMPTIDVVKHGKWLDKSEGYYWFGKCSLCETNFSIDGWYAENMNYCPNCGAKMDRRE